MHLLYAIINFLLLGAIVYFAGRKAIAKIFSSRMEKINSELDELERKLPPENLPEFAAPTPGEGALKEEEKSRKQKLEKLGELGRRDGENLRREMLLKTRSELIDATIARAEEQMRSEGFRSALSGREDELAEGILSQLKLTPGDRMYIRKEGGLKVLLASAAPLRTGTVEKLRSAAAALLSEEGAECCFSLKENEEELIGGFSLRIGDSVYDCSIKNRLYRLRETLNALPLESGCTEDVLAATEKAIDRPEKDVDIYQLGRVLSVSDGICWLDGLSDIMYGELVEFIEADSPMLGMVLDVQSEKIGCIIFGEYEHVDSYTAVRRLGRMASVPVGDEMLGRVVNPLGSPIDGKGRIWSSETRPIEFPAPSIPERQSVSVPLETGIKAIDALVPIGRGQRELIIGDRQTGKSSLLIDTIVNQKGKGVLCIYVAVGQKETTVAQMVSKLEGFGAMDYTTVICASASDSASMQYIAPFAGAALAEYFMYSGRDALIVYDDLSKHAVAYRELSLLLHRPSGREAYPGDVFYLHSRLLERAACLNKEAGGGSITALPVIETQAGDISAYIPTNVISITDGQIFLETDLFNAGQRPAINVGLSVSRVGGSAQTKLMKQVASNLRTGLAQYREYAAFAQFGSDVDEATRKTLDDGERMMAALRQPRFSPMPSWQQALLIYAVSSGAANGFESSKMDIFERELISWLSKEKPAICEQLKTGSKMSAEFKQELDAALSEFGRTA